MIPISSDQNTILTPLQREKRREEHERRKKERGGDTVGDAFYKSGPSRNPSRAFPRLRLF